MVRLVSVPGAPPARCRAYSLRLDGVGYETYSASTTDMVTFTLSDPTLLPGQPGAVFSPRAGRPGEPKPPPGAKTETSAVKPFSGSGK